VEILLIPVAIIAAVAVIALYFLRSSALQKRQAELFLISQKNGWVFSIDDPDCMPIKYGYFECMQSDFDVRAGNVISGVVEGYSFNVFDVTYWQPREIEGDLIGLNNINYRLPDKKVREFTCIVIETNLAFYPLVIRPETMIDKFADKFVGEDIDFESEEFSRSFYVRCADKKFAYDIVNPRTMDMMIKHKGWTVNLAANSLLVTPNKLLPAQGYATAVDFAIRFAEAIPEYITDQIRQQE